MPLLYDHKSLLPVSQDELDSVIRKHMLFAKGRVGGARAILTSKNLSRLNFRKAALDGADFSGSLLHDCDMRATHFDGTSFFTASLQRADLSHASLVRADLRGSSLVGGSFIGADLSAADLREGAMATKDRRGNINLMLQPGGDEKKPKEGYFTECVDAREADFTGVKFTKAFMRGANFEGAFCARADFSRAQMAGAKFGKAILHGAKFDGVELSEIDFHGSLRDEYAGLALEDALEPFEDLLKKHKDWVQSHGEKGKRLDFTRYDLSPRGEETFSFRDISLTMMKAQQALMVGVRFSGAELQAAELRDCDLRKTAFDRCDLRGIDFGGTNLTRATFQLAEMRPLKLPGGKMLRARLKNAILRYCDFTACDLTEVDFSGADLSFADVRGARLEGTQFTGAILEGVLSDTPING